MIILNQIQVEELIGVTSIIDVPYRLQQYYTKRTGELWRVYYDGINKKYILTKIMNE